MAVPAVGAAVLLGAGAYGLRLYLSNDITKWRQRWAHYDRKKLEDMYKRTRRELRKHLHPQVEHAGPLTAPSYAVNLIGAVPIWAKYAALQQLLGKRDMPAVEEESLKARRKQKREEAKAKRLARAKKKESEEEKLLSMKKLAEEEELTALKSPLTLDELYDSYAHELRGTGMPPGEIEKVARELQRVYSRMFRGDPEILNSIDPWKEAVFVLRTGMTVTQRAQEFAQKSPDVEAYRGGIEHQFRNLWRGEFGGDVPQGELDRFMRGEKPNYPAAVGGLAKG